MDTDDIDEELRNQSGTIQIGPYKYENVKYYDLNFKEALGFGSYGIVTKVVYNNWSIAVKEMERNGSEKHKQGVFRDLQVIRKSNDCPYIVKYYGYILTPVSSYISVPIFITNIFRNMFISVWKL